jgi:hypothetical protein
METLSSALTPGNSLHTSRIDSIPELPLLSISISVTRNLNQPAPPPGVAVHAPQAALFRPGTGKAPRIAQNFGNQAGINQYKSAGTFLKNLL